MEEGQSFLLHLAPICSLTYWTAFTADTPQVLVRAHSNRRRVTLTNMQIGTRFRTKCPKLLGHSSYPMPRLFKPWSQEFVLMTRQKTIVPVWDCRQNLYAFHLFLSWYSGSPTSEPGAGPNSAIKKFDVVDPGVVRQGYASTVSVLLGETVTPEMSEVAKWWIQVTLQAPALWAISVISNGHRDGWSALLGKCQFW